jgi:hypothetical protein
LWVLTLLLQHLLTSLPCLHQHLHLQQRLLLCRWPACAACVLPWGWAHLPVQLPAHLVELLLRQLLLLAML